jgi:hypothetical protein
MFLFFIALIMYFTLLNRMKHVIETNREYHNAIQKNLCKDIKTDIKKEAIDQLQRDYQTEYINLFEQHVQ